jgi:uncharacterized protein DUF2845
MKLPLVILIALFATTAQADNFRCGKWVATTDLTPTDLLAKCGEPASRATRTEDVMVRNANTGLMYKSGEQTIELWTYDRGTTASPMVITIVDGRIKSIERKK